jgi:cytochrome c551
MKAAVTTLALLACAAAIGACGSQGNSVPKTSPYYRGSVLFREHCSGCHTLQAVGAQGSATSIANRVRTNGPNFNIRKENVEQVLFAIRNGGFSGAIMPENIVVGPEAQQVAEFLAAYSGKQAPTVPHTTITLSTGKPETTTTGAAQTPAAAGTGSGAGAGGTPAAGTTTTGTTTTGK